MKCRGHAELLKVVDPGGLILRVTGRVFHYDYNTVSVKTAQTEAMYFIECQSLKDYVQHISHITF
jgi:hypothetical protein